MYFPDASFGHFCRVNILFSNALTDRLIFSSKCNVLQCVAMCCGVVQRVAAYTRRVEKRTVDRAMSVGVCLLLLRFE